jgi:glycerol-3-phosphate dehydrogenase
VNDKNIIKDVAVVGGGIIGLSIAENLAQRGYSVVLYEAKTCAAATSASSHCIIHGGFRYLASFDVKRVQESIMDLNAILKRFPEAVTLLPCTMPLNRWGVKSFLPLAVAAFLYHMLGKFQNSKVPCPSLVRNVEAGLLSNKSKYGLLRWYDGWLRDHSKLVVVLREFLIGLGVDIKENLPVLAIDCLNSGYVVSTDSTKEKFRSVVTACGPWETKEPIGSFPDNKVALAFNIIIDRKLELQEGVAAESADGRLFFIVPRLDGTALGTGYLECSPSDIPKTSNKIDVPEEEVRKFLRASSGLFDWLEPKISEIVRVEAGLLPVRDFGKKGPCFFGSSLIKESTPGRFSVLSTKYTSFPSTAERVGNKIQGFLNAT